MKIGKWIYLAVFSVLIIACETNRETFEEFVKDGETIYIGSADTVLVAPGFNKLRFYVALNADPKITKGLLKTADESIMHEFEVVRTKNGKDTVSFELEIPEGEYTFGLFLMDAAGNQSVRKEVPARVYGESYQESLINRGLIKIDTYLEGAVFHWDETTANMQTTILSYEDKAGVMQTVTVSNEESQTEVESYKLGGEIIVKSTFKPIEIAIEEFEALPSERLFPDDFLLDKSLITALRLPGDATDGCYGGNYGRLTDGSVSEYWHSCGVAEDQYPFIMSFDLGVEANLSRFKLDERQDCCGSRGPAAYQIWATNDISNAETVDIDAVSLADWEADAQAKGWVKLVDVTGNQQYTFEVEIPENGENYKYLRIVGISAIDGSPSTNFNEFTFWGK
ncbi:MAG: DUF4998 domain-containing protein [Anditalea sp.]